MMLYYCSESTVVESKVYMPFHGRSVGILITKIKIFTPCSLFTYYTLSLHLPSLQFVFKNNALNVLSKT